MNKLYVFCIGGSGLRVMKSLVMLLAAGYKIPNYELVPILIDPHKDLDELKNLKTLLDDYGKIKDHINITHNNKHEQLSGFFDTEIMAFNIGQNEKSAEYDFDSREDKSFGELMNLNSFEKTDINKHLIESLYSRTNIEKPLSLGFKGSPNVGCVVLNESIDNSVWFESFVGGFKGGDKVFIISSIFGGTGASGFPLIVKKIRKCNNEDLRNAPIGALSIMPYFDLKNPAQNSENREIDSSNFATKTKSAISYYNREVKVDYLYYIGDSPKERYENNECEQHNMAHIVELIGATAIRDFASKGKPSQPQYPGIAIGEDAEVLDISNIGAGYGPMINKLSCMLMLGQLVRYVPMDRQLPILRKLKMNDSSLFKCDEYALLGRFCDRFDNWLMELSRNKRSFSPLDLNIDATKNVNFGFPVHKKMGKNIRGIRFGISYYLLEMIRAANNMDKNERGLNNPLRQFMYCSNKAIDKMHNELLNK